MNDNIPSNVLLKTFEKSLVIDLIILIFQNLYSMDLQNQLRIRAVYMILNTRKKQDSY